MTAWIDAVPAIAITVLVLFLPGGVTVTILGARRLAALALAVPVSLGIVGVAAILLRILGIDFTPTAVAVIAAIVILVAAALRMWLFRPALRLGSLPGSGPVDRPAAAPWWNIGALVAAVVLPAVIIGTRYMTAIGGPDRISQTFDNIFHLNAVKFITATGDGSSLVLGNLTQASSGFYPAAFNDVAAVVSTSAGVGPAESLSTVTIILAAVVWPLSCLFLASRLFGNRPVPLLLTGVLSAGFAAFPYHLVNYGAVFPFHAAVAMMPLLLGLAIEILQRSRSRRPGMGPAMTALVLVIPGFVLTHPSVVVATLVLGTPFALGAAITALRARHRLTRRRFIWCLGVPVVYALTTLGVVLVARPALDTAPWFAFESHSTAIGSVLTSSPMGFPTAWAMFGLAVAGLAVGIRRFRRYWPLLAMFTIAGMLYVVASSWGDGRFRDLVVGVWYRDSHRVSAFLVIATLPLATLGAYAVVRTVHRWLLRAVPARTPRSSANLLVAVGLVAALVLLPLTQRGQIRVAEQQIADVYAAGASAPLLSDDERVLLERIDEHVPETDMVVGNPATGTAFAFALGSRRVLLPHVFGVRSPDEEYLATHWDEAATDPAVCALIRERHAYWALDFGTKWPHGDKSVLPGTDAVRTSPGIVEVDRVGDAALYRTTACG